MVIEEGPSGSSNRTTATFRFGAPGAPGARFRCAMDRGQLTACSSPWTRSRITEGEHVFRVERIDRPGSPGSPGGPGRAARQRRPRAAPAARPSAQRRFTIDLTPPAAAILGGPQGPTDHPTPSFVFSVGEPGSLAECRVTTSSEMPPMRPCSSPYVAAPLREGPASFELRVRDLAGNAVLLVRSFSVVPSVPTRAARRVL